MWDPVPWPGIEPAPLHRELRVLVTGPPRKFQSYSLWKLLEHYILAWMERECVYVCDCTAEYLQLRFRQIQEVNAKKSIEKQNHCCCSVSKSCPTLCDPMNYIQHTRLPCPSLYPGVCPNSCLLSQWCHPTSHPVAPFPPTLSLSQHQGLFQWAGSSDQVTRVLEFQLQHQSFQWIFRVYILWVDWFDLLFC